MRNRPLNPLRRVARFAPPAGASGAAGRIGTLKLFVAVCLAAVAARLGHLQLGLTDEYAQPFERLVERREPIPTTDGRILGSRGEPLAEDLPVYEISVHYGWIEEPPNPLWLRQQALARLDKAARRNGERVADEERKVLARRERLWRRLAVVGACNQEQLARARRAAQRRVEAIHRRVEQERSRAAAARAAQEQNDAQAGSGWARAWRMLARALTTPPRRDLDEPLVIQEQRDYHVVLRDVSFEAAMEVEAHPEWFPGTRLQVRPRRVYPAGELAAHVVGFRAPISAEWVAQRRAQLDEADPLDYQPADRVGRTGLEAHYERTLRGLRGERKVLYNRRGEVVSSVVVREPRPGQDLRLTLDTRLQRAAEELLDLALARQALDEVTGKPLPVPQGGAIVALDARTGAVLAAASAPRFDLRILTGNDQAGWRACLADPRKPLFHRAVAMALPPGSTFKVASAVAFLENPRFDAHLRFHCRGFLDEPDRYRCLIFRQFGAGHGDVDLVDALARSCNVYFFTQARRLGAAPILYWASQLGLGAPTGIDLPGESAGHLPPPERDQGGTASSRGRGHRAADALQLAIGQSSVTVTPLQMARLMALIANGGRAIIPHVADSTGLASLHAPDGDESAADNAAQAAWLELPSGETLDWVRAGLVAVVADPHGTGHKTARHPAVAIAGKTGTAEAGGGRPDHAWFAGYAPADRPRVAFAVVLEHGGSGGKVAGPLARSLVQSLLELDLLGAPTTAPSAN